MGLGFWSVVLAALRSMGTALTMAAFGGLLQRNNGPLKPMVLKNLARISMLVTIPCLLFTNILNCTQDWSDKPCTHVADTIADAWPMLFLPAVNVGIGAFLGWVMTRITKPPKNFERAAITACAFGNSTGLPITLLTVIHTAFSPTTDLGAINPMLFLSVYLLLYPMLQWGVGGALLGEVKDDDTINAFPTKGNPAESFLKGNNIQSSSKAEGQPKNSKSSTRGRNSGSVLSSMSEIDSYEDLIDEGEAGPSSCKDRCKLLLPIIFKPAVVSVSISILFAVTPVQGIFVDTLDRDDDAPLEWLFDGIYNVGRAAVPLNMFLLGAKLSKGAQWGQVSWGTNLGIAIIKLIIMPCVGVGTVFLLHAILPINPELAPTFFLVVMTVTCTPTANSIMVMAELSGQNKEALATCIFTQYLIAPFTLSASIVLFVSIAQKFVTPDP